MDNVTRLLMQGAAGATGGATYVDDVFSTYLWRGDGQSGRPISNGIKLSNNNSGNSVYFDGTGDYLLTNSSSDYTFGTGDFTVEHWLYTDFTFTGNAAQLIDARDFGASGDSNWTTNITASNQVRFFAVQPGGLPGDIRITTNTTLSDNTWYHVALVRSSGTTKMYIDGVQQTQTFTDGNNYNNTTLTLGIHGTNRTSFPFNGNLSDVRITKGQALYTSNFTPSTKSLTTTSQGATASNVKLLCCNTNTLTASPGTITAGGNVIAQKFGRFTANDGEGGMVWIKDRTNAYNYVLQDTVRGAGATTKLASNANWAQNASDNALQWSGYISGFNNGGFSLDKTGSGSIDWANVNKNGDDYTSWTFRKQKGFFDIVTYTGNGVAGREIAHSLGSVPGCIMVKNLSDSYEWAVYHQSLGGTKNLQLSANTAAMTNQYFWNNTNPTATHFTTAQSTDTNKNGDSYVAYIFAGGPSTEDTACSVSFDGSNDGLSATSSDLVLGTGDFTVECWFRLSGGNTDRIISMDKVSNPTNRWIVYHHQGLVRLNINGSDILFHGINMTDYTTWHHLAVVKHNNVTKLYIDGNIETPHGSYEYNDTLDYQSDQIHIGMEPNGGGNFDGLISNVRVVAGTAVYTSLFRPPIKPLTNITNTKLLCCNNSSVTGKTVGPTITATDSPTASTDSPFADPASFKFGEEGDQSIIKTGSYIGNGNSDGPEIISGWEPQWVLVKNTSSNDSWRIFDSMRGIVTGGDDALIHPNSNGAEYSGNTNEMDLTSTGFKIAINDSGVNGSGSTYIYMAIRRPDSDVAKPPEAGTDVFAIDAGNSSSIEAFTSGFPVDYVFYRTVNTSFSWYTTARMLQGTYAKTNLTDAFTSSVYTVFDLMTGFHNYSGYGSTTYAWMWKRHAGFDVVTYKGNAVAGRQIKHNLNVTPEMVVVKKRNSTQNWYTYHKGLNGGTNPELKTVMLNSSDAEDSAGSFTFNNTAPTSTVFSLASSHATNGSGDTYIALLFASVEGISKVGSFTGTGASQTITTGFRPRFLILRKSSTGGGPWYVLDTTRGWTSGNDQYINLNETTAQTGYEFGAPTATGFTITATAATINGSGENILYYAHA